MDLATHRVWVAFGRAIARPALVDRCSSYSWRVGNGGGFEKSVGWTSSIIDRTKTRTPGPRNRSCPRSRVARAVDHDRRGDRHRVSARATPHASSTPVDGSMGARGSLPLTDNVRQLRGIPGRRATEARLQLVAIPAGREQRRQDVSLRPGTRQVCENHITIGCGPTDYPLRPAPDRTRTLAGYRCLTGFRRVVVRRGVAECPFRGERHARPRCHGQPAP